MRRVAILFLAGFLCLGASTLAGAKELTPSKCKPEKWEAAIAAFERQDAKSPPPADAVLFVGSSSVRLWDVAKSFPDLPTINRGFGGSQICDATCFADRIVTKYQPRIIVFYSGDNDIAGGKSAEQVDVDFRAFVAKVRASLPETPIVVVSIKPSIARWKMRETMQGANDLIAADCKKDATLRFVDVWPAMLDSQGEPKKEIFRDDGLHMNDAGYQLWNNLVSPLLVELETFPMP
jgi:lysophospholipase L1-like esterase